jgi:hypothetical protein
MHMKESIRLQTKERWGEERIEQSEGILFIIEERKKYDAATTEKETETKGEGKEKGRGQGKIEEKKITN